MHSRPSQTLARVERTLRSRLAPARHRVIGQLTVRHFPIGDGQSEPVPAEQILANAPELPWQPMAIGEPWGPAWGTSWFEVSVEVPATERDTPNLEALIDLGWLDHSVGFQSEGLVFRSDGSIVKALNPRNPWLALTRADGGSELDEAGRAVFLIEAAANPLLLEVPPFEVTQLGEKETAGPAPLYRLARADLTEHRPEVAALITDVQVCAELAATLPEREPRRARLLAALDDALDAFDDQDLRSVAAARRLLAAPLAQRANASAHRLWAVGHAHIDSAWLWPLRETQRKVARTVANQLNLLDRHPQHRYAMSSAQQYAWLEERYPQLFARVRERVAEGRFLPVGGMWVESDTLMPSGEAMARQFVHGKRYFLDRFGVESREVWLPDSFGYSAALPQLARLAGFEFFLTQKISWSDTNAFPHHTFWWQGLDGSRIFTHFPPADTYGAEVTGAELAHAVDNFRDQARSSHSLLLFGYGDGGGGPTREMLARIDRWADTEGAPRVDIAAPSDFFEAARAEYHQAATWTGELHLELHRGTFTSQHATKRGNRRSEDLLLTAERAATAAAIRGALPYPHDELDAAWRTVLLHQFHDILPGSSIGWVHREAVATYERIERELTDLIERARAALAASGQPAADGAPQDAHDASPVDDGADAERATVRAVAGGWELTSGATRAFVDADGAITSLNLAGGPQLVAPGERLGRLELFADQPTQWDAWDIDRSAERRPLATDPATAIEPFEEAGRAGLRVRRTLGSSDVTEELWLAPGADLVHLDFDIDWRECERLVKLALPFDIDTDRAEFETQYGHLSRDITDNTSWQWAQHEVCTQRFVRLVQGERSVAILNDSSYGLSIARGERAGGGAIVTVRPSLLRAPRFPDPICDRSRHRLRFALAPAPTALDATLAARELNRVVPDVVAPELPWLAPGSTALIEAIKLADDRSGDLIVRLYETTGAPTRATLHLPAGFSAPRVVDLLERADAAATSAIERPEPPCTDLPARPDQPPHVDLLQHADGGVNLTLRGFQIVTLRAAREPS